MRKFEHRRAVTLEENFEAGNEVIDVRHVSQNIVGGHQICELSRSSKPSCRLDAEKRHLARDAFALRDLGNVGCRLDAEYTDVVFFEVLQEVAVVAGDLDHE